jgi:hypothetical protein
MFAGLTARLGFYACIVLILIGLGAGTVWYWLSDTIAELKAERKELRAQLEAAASARRAEAEVSKARSERRQKRVAESAASEAKDAAAIAKHPDWANTPVPKEVRDAVAD